jgi:hypothetical protein
VENALIDAGADEENPDFDTIVQKRMEEDLVSLTRGKAPEDMGRVLRSIFSLKQDGNVADAGSLISWLSASENVAANVKKIAGIKGDIRSQDAMNYLHGILEIIKAAGFKGLVIIIDEAETILRMRRDVRGKSLNGIRQICDVADQYRGLLWIFTGTPEFFDTRRGIAGLPPLFDRIQFLSHGGFANPRQPQLELKPFDKERLREVALKLREIYPVVDNTRLSNKITLEYIDLLIGKVTEGFKGDVGVVPRQFLRQFVDVMDLSAEHDDFNPMAAEGFTPKEPNEDEKRLMDGRGPFDQEPEDNDEYEPVEF